MTKQILSIILSMFVLNPVISQCTLYKLELSQKIAQSLVVVEGRVVEQISFLPDATNNGRIFTANVIEVYKIFKGSVSTNKIVLITEGGSLGEFMYRVEPSLNLRKGEVGMFFCESTSVVAQNHFDTLPQYRAYGSVQGFVRYDEFTGNASDPFEKYTDVQLQLYSPVSSQSGQSLRELKNYQLRKRVSLSRMAPIITAVNRDTLPAGIGVGVNIDDFNDSSIFIITGSNFEVRGANSKVFFRNANDGGATFIECPDNEVISWTDTQIELFLPSEAGSGNFRVQNNSNSFTDAAINLVIPYSHSNVSGTVTLDQVRRGAELQDSNGGGGYTISLSNSTANNGVAFAGSAAQGAFETAVTAWCGETGFNTMVGGVTAIDTSVSDDINAIMFDNDADPLPVGTLAVTRTYLNSCDGGNVWYLRDFDIRFRRDGTGGITWNFTTAATGVCCFDFYSVALHELGHAQLLSHVINDGGVMHHAIGNGENIRTIDKLTDSLGGRYIVLKSEFLNTCDGAVIGMLPCSVLPIEFISFEGLAKKNYNSLTWVATATFDYSDYIVERSDDGVSFEKIAVIPNHKPGSRPQMYTFDDRDINQETHYYRLKSISLDGEVHVSNIVELTNPFEQLQMIVYPNPATDQVQFRFAQNKHKNEMAFLQVTDMRGRVVHHEQFRLRGNKHILSIQTLSDGFYNARLYIPSVNVQKIVRLVKR